MVSKYEYVFVHFLTPPFSLSNVPFHLLSSSSVCLFLSRVQIATLLGVVICRLQPVFQIPPYTVGVHGPIPLVWNKPDLVLLRPRRHTNGVVDVVVNYANGNQYDRSNSGRALLLHWYQVRFCISSICLPLFYL